MLLNFFTTLYTPVTDFLNVTNYFDKTMIDLLLNN